MREGGVVAGQGGGGVEHVCRGDSFSPKVDRQTVHPYLKELS